MRLYLKYFSIHLRSAMQYKTSFFLTVLGQFLVSFSMFLGIYFMFSRFHTVEGFSLSGGAALLRHRLDGLFPGRMLCAGL